MVDDQRFARRVAHRILSEAGYRVLEADDGEEALAALRVNNARVDLVLADVVMPRMDGVELANQVWERWPDKRILFTSGHSARVLAEHGLEELEVPFLPKPFTRDQALAKVQEALQASVGERRKRPRPKEK